MIDEITKLLPPGTPIPHPSTVLYAFAPPNVFLRSSKRYTCRINFQHKVQRRQLHAYHADAHYCNCQRKYAMEYAVHYNNKHGNVQFISADDKAKFKYGEPTHALATLSRNKPGIAPTNKTVSAADHDVHNKGSVTPSVVLQVDIPDDPSISFYQGQVHVSLKCSIFQPSTCFRTLLELEKMLKKASAWSDVNTLILFTDGGPEHLLTYESVRTALCVLFKRNPHIDALIAIRTAPGQSYMNPVERTMSLCNIGLSNLALSRYGLFIP